MSIFEYDEEGVREVWRKECVTEGVQRTFDVKNLYSQGKSIDEIASELNTSSEEVSDIVERLKKDSDSKVNMGLPSLSEYEIRQTDAEAIRAAKAVL